LDAAIELSVGGVPVKIICIEEHAVDADVAEAARMWQLNEASYMAAWGTRVEDRPGEFHDDRPHLVSPKAAMKLASDLGSGRITAMDEHGIDIQIVSYSNSPQLVPSKRVVALVQAANDRLAEAVRKNPTRLGGMATLPWQYPEAAARELERAVNELDLHATLLLGRPGEDFLDDERYEPILAKLNELKAPLYVHPGVPVPEVQNHYYDGFDQEVSARLSMFGWGWHIEAGIQVLRLILSGKFEKYPDLRVISGHWGEMVPFYLQRLDDTIPREATGFSRKISEIYKTHVYVTPSGMLNLPHFEFIHKVLGSDRILYAVDYPYLTLTGARRFLEDLPISGEDKEKIAHLNAESLFRL
jgi:predicted TIM-barrel fold metal-dependent hydrolase